MTVDEGYELTDDGSESDVDPVEDPLESRLVVLRDIMRGYDRSFLLDVRDRMFVSRLGEALDLLGLDLELSTRPPAREGRLYRSDAEVIVRRGNEARRYRSSHVSSDPAYAVLAASRGAFESAGLMRPPEPSSGGVRISIRR